MMENSSFADRFWFARRAAELGAPTLMRQVAEALGKAEDAADLSPSLVSTIERKNQKTSRYNDAFARAFGVDPKWLAEGKGTVPRGFNAAEARAGRIADVTRKRRGGALALVPSEPKDSPAWASPEVTDEDKINRRQAELTRELIDFAIAVGPERMSGYLRSVEPLLATFGVKKTNGKNNSRSSG